MLRVGCGHGSYGTIGQAVEAASTHDTILVCHGTYREQVTIPATKALDLIGHRATIDATGLDNGITVMGSGSSVEGFTVENAIGEGILVVGAPGAPVNNVRITNNTVRNNDRGNPTGAPMSDSTYAECNAGPGNIPGDCGEGIHLMVANHVAVSGNRVTGNLGGILLTDEFGPTSDNWIAFNYVSGNLYDCGVTLAGHHAGIPSVVGGQPTGQWITVAPSEGGVYRNTVVGNTITDNGTKGQGAGVLMATGAPGGAVYDNLVVGNRMEGNGLGGVTVHSHLLASGQDLNGNVVTRNLIWTNNLGGDPDFYPYVDSQTTGVIVASLSPLSITVSHNVILRNVYGIWALPAVSFVGGTASNVFVGTTTPVCTATPTSPTSPPGCA